MKKILYIVESFGSGVFSFLVDLINEIDNDYNITIAYGVREETPENFRDYFDKNINFVRIKSFTRSISIKKDYMALKEIKNIIKELNPDIIHLHSTKAGILGRLAANGKKTKMFYNPHGFSFLKKDDSKIKRIVYWAIEKITAMINKKCTIIGCSKGEYKEALKLNKNSICINNGINIEKIKKETQGLISKQINLNDIKICTIGRIGYQKNPHFFNEIANDFPDIQFTWIGDGELRNELKSQNINITGWKNRKEVIEILNAQDIFILTSLWEGLPLSLLEAMYMKKLCIVSDCIGNRDVIDDGKNGFIAYDLQGYNKIIKNISIIDIKKITDTCRNDVINIYSIKNMVQEYKRIYDKEDRI